MTWATARRAMNARTRSTSSKAGITDAAGRGAASGRYRRCRYTRWGERRPRAGRGAAEQALARGREEELESAREHDRERDDVQRLEGAVDDDAVDDQQQGDGGHEPEALHEERRAARVNERAKVRPQYRRAARRRGGSSEDPGRDLPSRLAHARGPGSAGLGAVPVRAPLRARAGTPAPSPRPPPARPRTRRMIPEERGRGSARGFPAETPRTPRNPHPRSRPPDAARAARTRAR